MISEIEKNYHRTSDFYDKIEQIFHYIISKKNFQISSSEIFKIYKSNKKILMILFGRKIITPDDQFFQIIQEAKDKNGFKYIHYLYSVIKNYLTKEKRDEIESEIVSKYDETIDNF